ncbi:MAG: hypothetical protein HS131_06390 [Ignavibacteriales bacterium]|nr:hypothetical protein [Ignavibacteriales bacterium]
MASCRLDRKRNGFEYWNIWGITDDSGGYNKYIAADNAMLKLDEDNNLSRIDAEPGMNQE